MEQTVYHELSEVSTPWEKHKAVEYAKDGNTIVCQNRPMRRLRGNYYLGEIKGEGCNRRASIYAYYPGLDIALYLGRAYENNDVESILGQCRKLGMETPEQLIGTLDALVERQSFIKDIWIEIATRFAPERVAAYRASKVAYMEKLRQEEEEERKKECAEQRAQLERLQRQTEKQLQEAVNVLKSGGRLSNQKITVYRTVYDSKEYSILNYLAQKYGVNIPIKTRGWINSSLSGIVISDGRMTKEYVFKGKNFSTVIWKYMDQLIAAVRKEESDG